MMTKDQILSLIDEDIDKALDDLDKIFSNKNAAYNDLAKEYVAQPNNFSLASFRSRLKRLINIDQGNFISEAKGKHYEMSFFYDILCDLDFDHQYTHFKNIYQNRNVSAFLLHGESDEQGMDLKWLYHQLLRKEGLIDSRPIPIDFSSNANKSFTEILRTMCAHFKIDIDRPKLRKEIEKHLQTSHLVVLVKHPKETIDIKGFYEAFHSFFSYLCSEVVPEENHSLIFLFIENKLDDYPSMEDKYFLWFKEEDEKLFSITAQKCQDPKIIDLAAVGKIKANMIEDWIQKNLYVPAVSNNLACYLTNGQCLLGEGDNPYHVIQKIYSELKIDTAKKPDQWLIL